MTPFFRTVSIFSFLFFLSARLPAQSINELVNKAKLKIEQVNDYEASGRMKTNVTFLKVPVAQVKIYFKKPNKLKVKSEKGISFIPKGAVSINMNNVFSGNDYTLIDGGREMMGTTAVRIARLLPNDENSEAVSYTHLDVYKRQWVRCVFCLPSR